MTSYLLVRGDMDRWRGGWCSLTQVFESLDLENVLGVQWSPLVILELIPLEKWRAWIKPSKNNVCFDHLKGRWSISNITTFFHETQFSSFYRWGNWDLEALSNFAQFYRVNNWQSEGLNPRMSGTNTTLTVPSWEELGPNTGLSCSYSVLGNAIQTL